MKIFISYGRDCSDFVKKIKSDLNSRGHDVWLDTAVLKSGSDWRNEIADGIIKSQAVLVFLSSHSLREESVCHDEISISVACNRKIIRPILMEKGIDSKIPTIINGIQYFDFSDWKNLLNDDSWYNSKIADLLDTIENVQDDQYEQQMDALKAMLMPDHLRLKTIKWQGKSFVKRVWIEHEIEGIINSPYAGNLILIGFPGSGKSFFCSHYSKYSPNVICFIPLEWDCGKSYPVSRVLRNLAFQVASCLPAFRKHLLWSLSANFISFDGLSDVELFDAIIGEPMIFEIDDNNRAPALIIIDGVDEVTMDGSNPLAKLISEKSQCLPRFVHFLISTRNDVTVLRHYKGTPLVNIRLHDKNVNDDICEFLINQLSMMDDDCSLQVNKIATICGGSFLLADIIVNAIRSGGIKINDDNIIPESIHSIYFKWMSRVVSGDEFVAFYMAFSVLAAAETSITTSLLKSALGWNTSQLAAFMRRFRSFIVEEKDLLGNNCISLFHKSFRDWLSDESLSADIYSVSIEEGAVLLANASYEMYKDGSICNSDLIRLLDYHKAAHAHTKLDELVQDDSYLLRLYEMAKVFSKKHNLSVLAKETVCKCKEICDSIQPNKQSTYIKKVAIPLLEASIAFDSGDHFCVENIISSRIHSIEQLGTAEDVLESLYLASISSDLIGKRRESISYLNELISFAEQNGNRSFKKRALLGMVWNSHFSDMTKMSTLLGSFPESEDDTPADKIMLKLMKARTLLSTGELDQSLSLFSDVIQSDVAELWGYNHLSIRNQMLLIEAVVACYDNERFALGIQYGHMLFEHLSGMGSIAESYCLSWISMNYLMLGSTNQADIYLSQAERINRTSNGGDKSSWMSMHLKSVRAFWYKETGKLLQALELHEAVAEIARSCDDLWVLGDACFEVILLCIRIQDDRVKMFSMAKELAEVARISNLPHLAFKSSFADVLIERPTKYDKLKNVAENLMHKELPATDMVLLASLCWRVASQEGFGELSDKLRIYVDRTISSISANNPDGNYCDRTVIKNIKKELGL